jgi:hypothetical protein
MTLTSDVLGKRRTDNGSYHFNNFGNNFLFGIHLAVAHLKTEKEQQTTGSIPTSLLTGSKLNSTIEVSSGFGKDFEDFQNWVTKLKVIGGGSFR